MREGYKTEFTPHWQKQQRRSAVLLWVMLVVGVSWLGVVVYVAQHFIVKYW